jgi:hypothetical protein
MAFRLACLHYLDEQLLPHPITSREEMFSTGTHLGEVVTQQHLLSHRSVLGDAEPTDG